MELALLLVFVVMLELALTVWMLASVRSYRKRLSDLEGVVSAMSQVLKDVTDHSAVDLELPEPVLQPDVASLVSQATPEDVEQAQAILKALGMGSED